MRIALVYDRVNKFGGAERVLMALHEIWPEAPLFTSVYDPAGAPWADGWNIRTSWLQNIPGAKNNHESFGWLMPSAFESFDFSEFDVIISVTSEAAKGIITNPNQLHVCYLLTPTRYLWSHANDYLSHVSQLLKPLARIAQVKLRVWDYMAAQRPDYILSISKLVQKRCRKYYRRESEVVYPRLSLGLKRSHLSFAQGETLSDKNYFLVVSRLVPYKRIDLAIEACNLLKLPLVVIGIGSEAENLKHLAGPTVKFTGYLTDRELIEYYRNSKAVIMVQEEDFGLTAVEALSLGTPVISYRNSGAAEVIADGKTGVLFDRQTVESLTEAIKSCGEVSQTSRAKFAKQTEDKFSEQRFRENFKRRIEELWKKH